MSRVLSLLILLSLSQLASAQAPAEPPTVKPKLPATGQGSSDDRGERFAAFLNNSKFVGKFTIDGKEDVAPKTEEYTIKKCEKLPEADMYRFVARIKYGDVDNEVPMDLKVLWAGNTPVITLDGFGIPGMGNFGARVLIHGDRYAGTWQHDEKGGHLFGKIIQNDQ